MSAADALLTTPAPGTKWLTLDELVQRYVRLVLADCNGDKAMAARILDIDRKTIYRRLAR